MKLARGTLVLVVDGSRMLLMRNSGDAACPDLEVIAHHMLENPSNHAQMSDAPGVVHASVGPGRSTYEEAKPHQANEDRFAIEAARILGEATGNPIVVVAPPRTLAVLRRHYDRAVKKKLVAELDKDLTGHPVPEITRLLIEFEPLRHAENP